VIERKKHGRKLLIASIGVAAVSYVACGGETNDGSGGGGSANNAGNSVGNTGGSANTGGGIIAVGNLMAYPVDSGPGTGGSIIKDAAPETVVIGRDVLVGNLIAPPPQDAATEKAVFGFDVLVANLIAPPPPDAKADGK
jgi:hypothetical protein